MTERAIRPSREELATLLVELESSPATVARLRELWDGEGDPLNTLRWRVTPDALGVGGERNPRLAIPALERIVHARPTDESDRERIAAATAELRALLGQIAEDDRDLDRTLAQLGEVPAASAIDVAASGPDPATPRTRASRALLIVAGTAVLTLAAAAVSIAYLVTPKSSLAVFDRAQTAEEAEWEARVPLVTFPVDSGSARIVGKTETGVAVAYLNSAPTVGQERAPVCFSLLSKKSRENGMSMCGTEETFAQQGFGFTVDFAESSYAVQWGPTGDTAEIVKK